jgi:hypothetical protein
MKYVLFCFWNLVAICPASARESNPYEVRVDNVIPGYSYDPEIIFVGGKVYVLPGGYTPYEIDVDSLTLAFWHDVTVVGVHSSTDTVVPNCLYTPEISVRNSGSYGCTCRVTVTCDIRRADSIVYRDSVERCALFPGKSRRVRFRQWRTADGPDSFDVRICVTHELPVGVKRKQYDVYFARLMALHRKSVKKSILVR